MNYNKIIQKYTNPALPGSFSGLSGFLKNNEFPNPTGVKRVISSLPSYTLHKPIKYTFTRTKTSVEGIDDQWQVDLVDVSNIAGSNYKHNFILTCIDVFSKHAWAIPMLNKSADTTTKAFKDIFKDGRKPNLIYSDNGNEFKGACKKYLESLGIKLFISQTKVKASVVERFNRTLKEKMYRYFDSPRPIKSNLDKKKYIDVLDKLLTSYNNSYHRSIKCTPNQVNKSNEKKVFFNLFGYNEEDQSGDVLADIKYKQGTYVRIVKTKSIFEKGYTSGWSGKIFIIDKVFAHSPILYQVKNLDGDVVEGTYYAEELQQVELPYDTYEVIDQGPKNTIKVKQLNTESAQIESVDKTQFLKNQYSLRSRK